METLNYHNTKHALLDDLIKEHPKIYVGCRTKSDFLNKHKLVDGNQYIYVRWNENDKHWHHSDGSSCKYDKILIRLDWFNETFDDCNDDTMKAPDIIKLNENEMFKDDKNNVINIIVRGTRNFEECYFRAADVAKGFGLENLKTTILHNNGNYQRGKHYIRLLIEQSSNSERKGNHLYLTYFGIMKVLFSSRGSLAESFMTWAAKTLFTVQMGKREDRKKLAASIIGATLEQVNDVLSKSATPVSCVYLIYIGTVKDLRKSMNIDSKYPDNYMVFKYGMTKNLLRRIKEHKSVYGKIKSASLELCYYTVIDEQYIAEAESKLSNVFDLVNNRIAFDDRKELVVLSKDELERTKKEFNNLSELYCDKMANVLALIKEERHQNELLRKDNELLRQQNESLKRELYDKVELIRLEYELKIANMRLEMQNDK